MALRPSIIIKSKVIGAAQIRTIAVLTTRVVGQAMRNIMASVLVVIKKGVASAIIHPAFTSKIVTALLTTKTLQ